MAKVPSTEDFQKLVQLAQRTGKAFGVGGKGAPQEFADIEAQSNELSRILRHVAEALFMKGPDQVLTDTPETIRDGIAKLLLSCQQTLQDVDSLVNEHQTIVKKNTASGWTVERTWSPMVLANYKYMMWTSQGGSLQTLSDLLQMHTNTLMLTTQAIYSESLDDLEVVVSSLAVKIGRIHRESAEGDLSDRIQAVNRAMSALVEGGDTESLMDLTQDSDMYSLDSKTKISLTEMEDFPIPPALPPKSSLRGMPHAESELQSSVVGDLALPSQYNSRSGSISGSRAAKRMSDLRSNVSPSPSSASMARPPSVRSQMSNRSGMSMAMSMSPIGHEPLPPHLMAADRNSSIASIEMLPPAMVAETDSDSAMNLTLDELTLTPRMHPKIVRLQNAKTTPTQAYAFEKDAFKNSAILCDVRGAAVEYTRSLPRDPSDLSTPTPFDVEVVQVMAGCRICIVKKRESLSDGGIQISTSIWAFSDDSTVRLQQRLEDNTQYTPYSSYFSPEKISLTVPTELKHHDVVYGSRPLQIASTNWVNYVIADPQAAAAFQNELMSRTLLATYKTEATLRIHEGLSGVLAYQEQMCGMENLRIWEDEVTQGIFCMIHYSAQFRPGYFTFWLNSSNNPIRVKDDGGREVKIKGLRIYLGEDPKGKGKASPDMKRRDSASGGRRGSDNKRYVTGAKIEFSSEIEKWSFLDNVRELQQTTFPLPEIL